MDVDSTLKGIEIGGVDGNVRGVKFKRQGGELLFIATGKNEVKSASFKASGGGGTDASGRSDEKDTHPLWMSVKLWEVDFQRGPLYSSSRRSSIQYSGS